MLGEGSLKQNVFRWRRKDCKDVAETRLFGSTFQILAAATGKARPPTEDGMAQQLLHYSSAVTVAQNRDIMSKTGKKGR